jgi:hypothetical protein
METITNTLRSLEIGHSQQFRNLTAFPLINRTARAASYLPLAKAIHDGNAEITEVSEGGSVQQLLLNNTGDQNVLILDGEELLGAKQNRIANLSILAAAHSKTVLPVSCVEHGRWSYASRKFKAAPRVMYHRARAAKAAAHNFERKATGTYGADQGMVWDNISAKQERMHVQSETSAMSDTFEHYDEHVEDYTRAFPLQTNQVGVMFAIDGVMEGMDLFDATSTLSDMLPKLVRSFAIDALETANSEAAPAEAMTASRFLDRVAAANSDSYPGVGIGTDIRLSAPLLAGGGLVYEEQLLHLVAFSTQTPEAPREPESRYETALRRQRYERMRRRNQDRDE